jgi:HPr kinase/phosphorylase
MIELRGRGIVTLPFEPAVVLSHVIDLLPPADIPRYPEPAVLEAKICGAKLPRLAQSLERSSYDCALSVLSWLGGGETI